MKQAKLAYIPNEPYETMHRDDFVFDMSLSENDVMFVASVLCCVFVLHPGELGKLDISLLI